MLELAERQIAAVTDAAINDLTPAQACAIHHEYLYAVWRFRADYRTLLTDAKKALRAGLRRRNIWLGE